MISWRCASPGFQTTALRSTKSKSKSRLIADLGAFAFYGSRLGDHRISQNSQSGDFDFARVAGLKKHGGLAGHSDARRSAGEDQIARFERHDLRNIGDQLADAEDQLSSGRILHCLTVQSQLDREALRIRNFISADEPGTCRGERVGSLSQKRLLPGLLELPVAGRNIVAVHIAGNVIPASDSGINLPRLPITTINSAS